MDLTSHGFYYLGPAETREEALERLYNHRGAIAVDTETIGLKGDKSTIIDEYDEEAEDYVAKKVKLNALTCIGFGIALSPTEAFYFPLGKRGMVNVPIIDPYAGVHKLQDPLIKKLFFNSMFDLERLDETFGVDITNFEDVAIGCQVQGLWNALDQNVINLLGMNHNSIDDVLPKGKTMLDLPYPTVAFKCMCDVMDTFRLYLVMRMDEWDGRLKLWKDYYGREFDVTPEIQSCYMVDKAMVPLLRKMTKRGLAVNNEKAWQWKRRLDTEIRGYDNYFSGLGINPQSADQVGWLLSQRGAYVGLSDSKKHLKVDEEFLRSLKDPVAYMVLARKRRQKLRGTYIEPLLYADRVHPHFRLDLATGRLASWGPNIQNQPDLMREVFLPDTGLFSWADLEQAELRVWADQAQDQVMIDAFGRGESPHVSTLNALFPGRPKKNPDGSATREYTDSKGFNFALLADASPDVMAKATHRPVAECARLKTELYGLYWKSKLHQDYMRVRHTPYFYPDYVESDFGRRCHIPDSIITTYTHQEKCRLNYPFQATVADYIKRMSLGLQYLDLPIQVHDEQVQDGNFLFPGMDEPASEKPMTVHKGWMTELHPRIRMPYEVKAAKVWI